MEVLCDLLVWQEKGVGYSQAYNHVAIHLERRILTYIHALYILFGHYLIRWLLILPSRIGLLEYVRLSLICCSPYFRFLFAFSNLRLLSLWLQHLAHKYCFLSV